MRGKIVKVATLIMCLMVAATAFGAEKAGKDKKLKSFTAVMSGKEVVPSVDTSAKGKAVFTLNDELDGINYSIDVSKMENVTSAHIHQGAKGKNGPPIVSLLEGQPDGEVEGNLVEGVILEMDLIGPLEGKPLEALIELLEKGNTYVNIHTEKNPNGEIRGSIK